MAVFVSMSVLSGSSSCNYKSLSPRFFSSGFVKVIGAKKKLACRMSFLFTTHVSIVAGTGFFSPANNSQCGNTQNYSALCSFAGTCPLTFCYLMTEFFKLVQNRCFLMVLYEVTR